MSGPPFVGQNIGKNGTRIHSISCVLLYLFLAEKSRVEDIMVVSDNSRGGASFAAAMKRPKEKAPWVFVVMQPAFGSGDQMRSTFPLQG